MDRNIAVWEQRIHFWRISFLIYSWKCFNETFVIIDFNQDATFLCIAICNYLSRMCADMRYWGASKSSCVECDVTFLIIILPITIMMVRLVHDCILLPYRVVQQYRLLLIVYTPLLHHLVYLTCLCRQIPSNLLGTLNQSLLFALGGSHREVYIHVTDLRRYDVFYYCICIQRRTRRS